MTKICCACKDEKDLDEFNLNKGKKDGHNAMCSLCHKEYVKNHYHAHRREYCARVKAFKAEKRIKMYQYLSDKKCVDCGENDPLVLDFDHRDKSKKERGIAEMLRKNSWENILREIEKCEIRCSNCHRRRTAKQLGYTKYLLQQNETQPRLSTNQP